MIKFISVIFYFLIADLFHALRLSLPTAMAAIQSVFIKSHEQRTEPKPHIVYRIEITASVRSWSMWHRYSDFVDLNTELTHITGQAPPLELPPKHALSIFTFKKSTDEGILEERRTGLEAYLRAIVANKDDRWRTCHAFNTFLGVPVGRNSGFSGEDGIPCFSSAAWLDEHIALGGAIRDVRADINKRTALQDAGDVTTSHIVGVQAKKRLAEVLGRIRVLTTSLQALGLQGLGEGELQRRTDLLAKLQDDCEKCGKMLTVTRQSRTQGSTTGTASEPDRKELFSGATSSTSFGFKIKPPARVFGAPAQETSVTRPLDDAGILQSQQQQIEVQDQQASQLSAILSRQRHLAMAIHEEITLQNDLLDDLNNEVEHTGDKLRGAKKQLNRLDNS